MPGWICVSYSCGWNGRIVKLNGRKIAKQFSVRFSIGKISTELKKFRTLWTFVPCVFCRIIGLQNFCMISFVLLCLIFIFVLYCVSFFVILTLLVWISVSCFTFVSLTFCVTFVSVTFCLVLSLSVWPSVQLCVRAASRLAARGCPCRQPRTMDTRYYTLPTCPAPH